MSSYLQTPYERIPRIWISNETPPRALFVKGRSGLDPDVLVAYAENDPEGVLWIVDDGSTKYDKPDYFVCSYGDGFRARPVLHDATSALMASAIGSAVGGTGQSSLGTKDPKIPQDFE